MTYKTSKFIPSLGNVTADVHMDVLQSTGDRPLSEVQIPPNR